MLERNEIKPDTKALILPLVKKIQRIHQTSDKVLTKVAEGSKKMKVNNIKTTWEKIHGKLYRLQGQACYASFLSSYSHYE